MARATALINGRNDLSAAERADHLTVLRFVAEREHVPESVLDLILPKEKLMESSFYQSILNEGKVEGRVEGLAQAVIRLFALKLGRLDPAFVQIIQREKDLTILNAWLMDIGQAPDAEAAARIVRKISAACGS